MSRWVQRLSLFLLIAVLVGSGLGWVTLEVLRLEENQREAAAKAERAEDIHMALWRLDGWMAPQLAREDGRPYAHYSALLAPIPAMNAKMTPWTAGTVRIPSPLLDAPMPDWMLLHFQFSPDNKTNGNWQSPEVLPEKVVMRLRQPPFSLALANVSDERANYLKSVSAHFSRASVELVRLRSVLPELVEVQVESNKDQQLIPPNAVVANPTQSQGQSQQMYQQGGNTSRVPNNYDFNNGGRGQRNDNEFQKRESTLPAKAVQPQVQNSLVDPDLETDLDALTATNGTAGCVQEVRVGSMVPLWMPSLEKPDRLLYVRLAKAGKKEVIQGLVIDWPLLEQMLSDKIADLFPDAHFVPQADGPPAHPDRTMSSLPLELDPGPAPPLPRAGFTPLRIGLCLAWVAALIALSAVGLGGWSLIDLSDRRIRFVSAVTHELRTPLTTLRLYLDMLNSGMVREEEQRQEYLQTLQGESERLHRLIGNVLDFARLEKQATKTNPAEIRVAELLEIIRSTWYERCCTSGKELVVEDALPPDAKLVTDSALLQQIVGNLIDNSCKYSQSASDRRIWLRAATPSAGRLVFDVEDCGPGVKAGEKRSIFRPFRRGCNADVTAGGVGLGLALARRWAQMLGGKLEYRKGDRAGGACFRVELPAGR
jgi:signal transduction histidine kinase